MIAAVKPGLHTGERHGYASALDGLWNGLSTTLARLEEIAADPDTTLADEERTAQLPGLQYALHAASETAAGIEPPADSEVTHAELAAALADARDTTADVADAAAAGGPESAWPLVYEWRGALFRVRLARARLTWRPPPAPAATPPAQAPAHGAVALVTLGALAIILGALFGVWPVAAAGLALAGVVLIRSHP